MTDLTKAALAEFQRRTMTLCGSNRTPVDEAFLEIVTATVTEARKDTASACKPPIKGSRVEELFSDSGGRFGD